MQIVLAYGAVACTAFIAHFGWEMLHIQLYAGYEALGHGWRLTVWATSGDVMYTLLIAVALSFVYKRPDWFLDSQTQGMWWSALAGSIIALFVEYKAMYMHLWTYTSAMPIVPLLNVGLSPLMQMTLLVPLTFVIVRKISAYYRTQY